MMLTILSIVPKLDVLIADELKLHKFERQVYSHGVEIILKKSLSKLRRTFLKNNGFSHQTLQTDKLEHLLLQKSQAHLYIKSVNIANFRH